MTPTLHANLLAAFLDGKSCATIARTFNLSIQDVLSWFESELTQTTLSRLEALQHHQARLVSFKILSGASDSLTDTCATSPNPALRTRAASGLLRLGLRFAPPGRVADSAARRKKPHPTGESQGPAFDDVPLVASPTASFEPPRPVPSTRLSPSSSRLHPHHSLAESLRAEYAALRNAPRGNSKQSRAAVKAMRPASLEVASLEVDCATLTAEPSAPVHSVPLTPLFSRRTSRASSLRASAGSSASREAAAVRAPPAFAAA